MKGQRQIALTKIAYTIDEAAQVSGLSPDTIRRAIRSKDHPLVARRSGVSKTTGDPAGKHLILHDDLVAWLEGLGAA